MSDCFRILVWEYSLQLTKILIDFVDDLIFSRSPGACIHMTWLLRGAKRLGDSRLLYRRHSHLQVVDLKLAVR